MSFIKYLKSPLKYHKDIDKVSIVDSLIMLGINVGLLALTVLIILAVGLKSVFGFNFYGYSFSIPFKYYFMLMGLIVTSTIISIAAVSALFFLIKRIKYKEGRFEEGVAYASTSLLWPGIIIPVSIIGLAFGGYSAVVIGIVFAISAIIFTINIYESLKIMGIGSGKAAYIAPAMVMLFNIIIYGIVYLVGKLYITHMIGNIWSW